jgi:hypothetical protein
VSTWAYVPDYQSYWGNQLIAVLKVSALAELHQEAPEEKRDYHHDYDVHSGTPLRAVRYMCESRLHESVAYQTNRRHFWNKCPSLVNFLI